MPSFSCSWIFLSSEMHPKLLRDSKTDVTANGHERCARGMRNVPIDSEPDVHSGTHAHVGRNSGQQRVPAAPALSDSRDAVIPRLQPRKHRANEPLAGP